MGNTSEELLQNSWQCVFVIIIVSVTGVGLIGNSLVIMNPITPALKQTYSEIYQDRYNTALPAGTWTTLLALTMSILYAGGLVGSLLVNPLLTKFTRKQSLLPIYLMNSTGLICVAIGTTVAKSYELVIVGRFIAGISVGLGSAIFPLVVNEYSVSHKRLHYGALYGTLFSFSALISTIIAWSKVLGSYENYLGALLYGLLYSIIYFLAMYWIPETPYQAELNNDSDQELDILTKLRTGCEVALEEMENSIVRRDKAKSKPLREATWKEIFTIPQFRKHFIAVVFLFIYLPGCGLSNVVSFSDKIFAEAGLPKDATTPSSMGIHGVSSVFSIIGVVMMRKFDARNLLLFFCSVLALTHALMTASIETFHHVPAMSWAAMVAMWMFMACFSSIKTLGYGIVGILCVAKTRSKTFMIGVAGFWTIGWIVGFIAPYLTVWIQGYSFLVWMAITLPGVIFIYFCVPKTKDKSEDEIQSFFKR